MSILPALSAVRIVRGANKNDSEDAADTAGAGTFVCANGGVAADGGHAIFKRGAAHLVDAHWTLLEVLIRTGLLNDKDGYAGL